MVETDVQWIEIPVEGLVNQDSARLLERAIRKIKNVSQVNVEFSNQRLFVDLADKQSLEQVIKKVRNLGYGVPTLKKTVPVSGLSCAACATSVQKTLSKQNGVLSAQVNFANAKALVEYIGKSFDIQATRKAVQSSGYDIEIEETASTDIANRKEKAKLIRLKRKTILAIGFTIPVVLISMVFTDLPWGNYIMWACSTPVLFYFGNQFFINGWKQIRHRQVTMDTLVALSTGIAYSFSVFNIFFPKVWTDKGFEAHVYFEAAAVIISFILIGRFLEEKAKSNTSTAIKKLFSLQPAKVTVVTPENDVKEISISAIEKNQIILVRQGERIPVDGAVVKGRAHIDESMVSGEPLPVFKQKKDDVFSGTFIQEGFLHIRAIKVGAESFLGRIITAVEQAQGSKAPVQKLVDKVASIFVPTVMIVAILSLTGWLLWGGVQGTEYGILAMVTVLIIACPCALGLATPTAIMVGMGRGAEEGILIKDAESLEIAQQVDALVLDKTGTITQGDPVLKEIKWFSEIPAFESYLYHLQLLSDHPLAKAVVHTLNSRKHILPQIKDYNYQLGKGIEAFIDDRKFLIGSHRWMMENKIKFSGEITSLSNQWAKHGDTMVYFSKEDEILAILRLGDQIKETSGKAINILQKRGIKVFMLTGDQDHAAKSVADKVGIKHYQSGLLPDEKRAFVKKLQEEGKKVAMIGDGINDAEALAQADLSIAMGKGSDIAIDVAKITIISNDLLKVPRAIQLSKETNKTIRQNLFWAFIYNAIGIPIATGAFFSVLGFLLNPMIAGAAMALSSVSVVSNSLRLKYKSLV